MGGVPKEKSTIHDFFSKASKLVDGDVSDKEGLKIKVLNEGEGDMIPKGAFVTVHYTGKFLDGKVFDSSVKRGDPFQFVCGQG